MHGRRKVFFQGGPLRDFPKFFHEGPKVVKFVFSLSKLRKQPFLAEIFKIQEGQGPLLPRPSDAHEVM